MGERRFKDVGVLMGGPSSERSVSLKSGAAVAAGLRRAAYNVVEIDVEGPKLNLPGGVEAVFIALHGTFGEDGTVQQLLTDAGMPYTGSGVEASRISFDKLASKQVFEQYDVPVPPYEVIERADGRTLALPVVIKPAREGSSIGVHRVFSEDEWEEAFSDTVQYGKSVLVERYIEGHELTVGIVGDDVLPVVEIRPPEGYYDYEAKYLSGQTVYDVPANIPSQRAEALQRTARRAYDALGCRGMGRIDFRMTADGDAYVLENNSIPGFTETSLLPKAARAAGIEFPELCRRIMESACL